MKFFSQICEKKIENIFGCKIFDAYSGEGGAIAFDEISEDDYNYLKSLSNNRNSVRRKADYHLYLSKKYLWNNYQPKLARKHLSKSFKIKLNKLAFFYYIVSLFPERMIKKLYRKFK